MSSNYLNTINGQSNHDLCLKAQGGMDSFVNNLIMSGVSRSGDIPIKYRYDLTNLNNILIAGRNYSTLANSARYVLNTDGTILLNTDGEKLTDEGSFA
jgi:hypothetical protein